MVVVKTSVPLKCQSGSFKDVGYLKKRELYLLRRPSVKKEEVVSVKNYSFKKKERYLLRRSGLKKEEGYR